MILESKLFPTKLQDLNYVDLNNKVRSKIDLAKTNNLYSGIVIAGFTFPSNMIDIPVDIHINIGADSLLMNKLINQIQKQKQIRRLELEESNIFLGNTYSQNRFNKSIKLSMDYENELNQIYHQICQIIFENIEKKLYGDSYNDYKSKKLQVIEDQTIDLDSISIDSTDLVDLDVENKTKISDSTDNIENSSEESSEDKSEGNSEANSEANSEEKKVIEIQQKRLRRMRRYKSL
jgi:hypothetical protein